MIKSSPSLKNEYMYGKKNNLKNTGKRINSGEKRKFKSFLFIMYSYFVTENKIIIFIFRNISYKYLD